MSKIEFHVFKNNTDAIPTNRGFYYQYLMTVKLWIQNYVSDIDNEIYCEREEDIFEVNIENNYASFRQIKCYGSAFSLNSKEIKSTLLNFYKLYLKYKSIYKGTFYFQTNSDIIETGGSSLSKWYKKQQYGDYSAGEYLDEVKAILKLLVKDNLKKFTDKNPDVTKVSKAQTKAKEFDENLDSDDFANFLSLIRWDFNKVEPEKAISSLLLDVKELISSRMRHNTGLNEDFILAYLLNTVIDKSVNKNINERLLSNALLKAILQSSDLKETIIKSLHKEVLFLMHNDFQILNELEVIKNVTEDTREIVRNLHNKLLIKENLVNLSLAANVKSWFKAVGYQFESYEKSESDMYGFIINITVRRSYDRIYILCVSESVELTHLNNLKDYTKKNNCDEGWIITYKRISPSVRKKSGSEDYDNLYSYTFDELIDENIDFSGYFDWLEDEVTKKNIDSKFIPLYCKKDTFDENSVKIDSNEYLIENYIDKWIDDPSKRHISVLGEFGMGKTWFALHYTWTKLKKYKEAVQLGTERPRIPIFLSLRDFAKAINIEGVFSEFFFKKHNSPIPNYNAFTELNKMGKLLLIFDGFDEMADRIDNQKMINNFWELARIIDDNSKVILTCRNEHFPDAKQGRDLLNAQLQASTQHLIIKAPAFEVLDLLRLTKSQIKTLLRLNTTEKVVKKILKNKDLIDLASRPIMTDFIIEALKDIEEGKPIDLARIYLYAIRNKMNKDIREERTFTSLADKLFFMSELSWEMLSTDNMSINYRLIPDRIRKLFSEIVAEQKDIDHWQYDMMGQSMLIRNDDGEYKPSHRSLLEFFTAYKFTAELGLLNRDFISLAQTNSKENLETPVEIRWNEYFQNSKKYNLSMFKALKIDQLKFTFGHQVISRAILDFIKCMIAIENPDTINKIDEIINKCRNKSFEEVGYAITNLITIIVDSYPNYFTNKDLSNLVIRGFESPYDYNSSKSFSSLNTPQFINTDFTGCDLTDSNFGYPFELSNIKGAKFTKANITGFRFHFSQISEISFLANQHVIAVGSPDEIKLLNANNFSVINRIEGNGWHVTFSPDGLLLVHSSFGSFVIRNTTNYDIEINHKLSSQFNPNAQEKGENLWTGGFAFTKDSKNIYVGCNNSFIYHYNIETNSEIRTFQCFEGVNNVSLSYDEKYLVGSEFNAFTIWDIETGEKIFYEKTEKDALNKIIAKFHPNENILVISNGKTIRFYNISEKSFYFEQEIQNVGDFCFSKDFKTLYTHNYYYIYFIDIQRKTLTASHRIEVLNEIEKKSHESIAKIMVNTNSDDLMLITHKQIVVFNIYVLEVTYIYQNLINLENCDFREVKGANINLLNQLEINGAIIS
jgi:predicted NACHT family NTPase